MYDDRTVFKKKMLRAKQDFEDTKDPKYQKFISRYNNIQMARKISLNSAYGAIGNEYFRYYDLRLQKVLLPLIVSCLFVGLRKRLIIYLNKLLDTD